MLHAAIHCKLAHVCHYLTALAGRAYDRPLLVCGDVRRSADDAAARVAALAAALRCDAGVVPGDRVALVARSSASAFEALLAVLAAGAVAAPLNTRWSGAEASAAADLVGVAAVIYDPASAKLAIGALRTRGRSKRRVGIVLDEVGSDGSDGGGGSGTPGALAAEALIARRMGARLEPVLAPEGAAVVCFTSGTTGAAKGALLSHAAFHCQVCRHLRLALFLPCRLGRDCSDAYCTLIAAAQKGPFCQAAQLAVRASDEDCLLPGCTPAKNTRCKCPQSRSMDEECC